MLIKLSVEYLEKIILEVKFVENWSDNTSNKFSIGSKTADCKSAINSEMLQDYIHFLGCSALLLEISEGANHILVAWLISPDWQAHQTS